MSTVQEIQEKFGVTGAWGESFDAANNSHRRSMVPGYSPTDFKHEFHDGTRHETIKKSRYTMKNNGLPREIRDLNVLYGVGPEGLWPYPMLTPRSWLTDAVAYFKEWSLKADVTERFSFVDIQKLASKHIDTDGEFFPIKSFNRFTEERRLQLIETHRVGNFLDVRSGRDKDNPERWIDGIKVDSTGKPTHIKILQDNGKTRNIPWFAVMHLFDAEASSAYRHPPTLTHSVNHILDEGELLALEKHAAKQLSDVVYQLKTDKGAFDGAGADFSASGGRDAVPDGTDPKALQRITGGKVVNTYTHEELKVNEFQRPSSTFTGFLQHLRKDATLGAMPYEFAIDPAGTGPAIRLILDKASRRFKQRTDLISNRLIRPTWFYVIGHAIDTGVLPTVKNWSKVTITPPKDVTIDVGRDSEANRRDIAAGLKLPTDSYEERGRDFLSSMEEKARLIKAVEEIASENNVDPEQLYRWIEDPNGSTSGTPPSGDDKGSKGK